MTRYSRALILAGMLSQAAFGAPASPLVVCDDVQGPPSLNPYRVFSEKAHTLLQQMLEGLIRIDASGRIEPCLAERWERAGENSLRFFLRKDVRFHNGEPFNARSVKFSLEKFSAPETKYPGAAFLESIASVVVVDDYTVDVVTRRPDGVLLNRLAAWAHIVPPLYYQTVGDDAFAQRPVGTGPFRFESWEKDSRVVMSANRDYWMKGYPKASGLVFRFIPTDEQFSALESGEIDLLTELPGTRTTDAMRTGHLNVLKTPSFYTVTGALDTTRPPLNDKRVRQALNHAINKEELIRYDLLGNGHAIATVTMPGEDGHNARLKPYAYDLKKARRLLQEAGYPEGFSLRVLAKAQSERAAKILRGQLAKIGVKLDVDMVADAEMIGALNAERWDVFISNCPDPMAHSYFIQSIFLYASSPYSLGKNPSYNEMLEAVVAALDEDKRRVLAEKLDAYMHEEALLLFTYQRIKTCGVRTGVNFTPSITGMPYFFGVSKTER